MKADEVREGMVPVRGGEEMAPIRGGERMVMEWVDGTVRWT